MKDLFSLQFTIFTVIAAGCLLRRAGVISREGQKSITGLVLNLVLPCNIIVSFLTTFSADLLRDFLIVLVLSCVLQAASLTYGKLAYRRESPDHRTNLCYGILCSNSGFLGTPIAEGLYGPVGLMFASSYLIPQRITMWAVGIRLYSGERFSKSVVKKVLLHPCVLACIIGLILFIGQISLPGWIYTPISNIAQCNTALSMMVIGMILADMDPRTLIEPSVIRYTLERLIVIPLIVLFVCRILHLSSLVTAVSVILTAMPAGATTSMLAFQYDQDPEYATKLVIFSTLCSIPSIMAWSILLH